eukprot:8157753-Ditylum_brightwellii.AAC.1
MLTLYSTKSSYTSALLQAASVEGKSTHFLHWGLCCILVPNPENKTAYKKLFVQSNQLINDPSKQWRGICLRNFRAELTLQDFKKSKKMNMW